MGPFRLYRFKVFIEASDCRQEATAELYGILPEVPPECLIPHLILPATDTTPGPRLSSPDVLEHPIPTARGGGACATPSLTLAWEPSTLLLLTSPSLVLMSMEMEVPLEAAAWAREGGHGKELSQLPHSSCAWQAWS